MPKVFVSGAPHRMALELSAELAPERPPKEVFREANAPFVEALKQALAHESGFQRTSSIAAVADALRQRNLAWLESRRSVFEKAGYSIVALEGIDECRMACRSCLAERVFSAGITPSNKQLKCQSCSKRG